MRWASNSTNYIYNNAIQIRPHSRVWGVWGGLGFQHIFCGGGDRIQLIRASKKNVEYLYDFKVNKDS